MRRVESEAFAKRVVHFYENMGHHDMNQTCLHFMEEGFRRSLIYKIIKRYLKNGYIEYKKIPGRKPKITESDKRKVEKLLTENPNITIRKGGQKLKMSSSSFRRIKNQLGFKSYKCQYGPKYSVNQEKRAKTACRKLYRKVIPSGENKVLIIDDETYVPIDPEDIPGTKYYHCKDPKEIPRQNKIKPKSKFFKKFLVWQALDENGNVSNPFISDKTQC